MASTSIAEQLAKLKDRRDKLDKSRRDKAAKIETAARNLETDRRALEDLDTEQRGLDADVDATARLETDLAGAAKARTEAHDLGADDVTKIGQAQTALAARIEQELSQARRDALATEIDKIDAAIAKAATAADAAAAGLATAEKAAADARVAADAAAAEHADVLRQLVAVPQRTEAARARVAALHAAANAAVDSGRTAEAFVRNRDLQKALTDLDAAVKDPQGGQLADRLPKLWSDNLAAAAALTSARAAVEPLRAKATEARQQRDALAAARDENIAAALSKPGA
ncbi:hypothetical protein [Actinoplanes sp. NPDC026670]|uniref:hypothetical protein n=1 Tax=Actinoplanes sp. NPDC026670 TaxID=3154700 RepID=UPI00340A75F7